MSASTGRLGESRDEQMSKVRAKCGFVRLLSELYGSIMLVIHRFEGLWATAR